jgi:imidazolonepropionase-like amidohydrolase
VPIAGFSLHDELEWFVAAGLTPGEALAAATSGPARYFGEWELAGTVEAGKRADLVLLEANPLDDIRNTRRIEAVVSAGRLFDRATLDGFLEQAATDAKSR